MKRIAFWGVPDGTVPVNTRTPREIETYRKGSNKKMLRRAIEHLNDEAFPGTEMIVVTDAATDVTLLRVYRKEEPKLVACAKGTKAPYIVWDGVLQGKTVDKGWSTRV